MGVGNVLSGNHQPGILLYGAGNVVRGNRIGVAAGSQIGLGNGIAGIYFLGSSDNLIGGTAPALPMSELLMGRDPTVLELMLRMVRRAILFVAIQSSAIQVLQFTLFPAPVVAETICSLLHS